jgi:phage terminase Nu1 subunit (DNA packaging protein)
VRVNLGDMAATLGVSPPTITAWIKNDGLPSLVRGAKGKQWEFDTVEVITWWAKTKFKRQDFQQSPTNPFGGEGDAPETIEHAQRRYEIARADKVEAETARATGMLVPVDEVTAIVVEENARVRARILSIPTKIRPRALVLLGHDRKAAEQVVAAVEEEILGALEEVKSWAPSPEDDDVAAA